MKDFAPKPQHQHVLQESNKKAINDLTKRFEALEKSVQTLAKFIQQPKGKKNKREVKMYLKTRTETSK